MLTIAAMPITMPMIVRKLRSFRSRMLRKANLIPSFSNSKDKESHLI